MRRTDHLITCVATYTIHISNQVRRVMEVNMNLTESSYNDLTRA